MFDPEELTLATPEEKKVFTRLATDILKYMDGKLDGVRIRQEIAGSAVLAKLVQTRGPMALMTYNMRKQDIDQAKIEDKRGKRI
jgi:hypothetical protein